MQLVGRKILKLSDNEVFVDAGAFDGDTARSLIRRTGGQYFRIYLFEPDSQLLARAQTNLAAHKNIQYVNRGLSSREEELRFSATGGPDGAIDAGRSLVIKAVALDGFVSDEISYLKLDVEGAEAAALTGAACHLRQDIPGWPLLSITNARTSGKFLS